MEPPVSKKPSPPKTSDLHARSSDRQGWMLVASGFQIAGVVGLSVFVGYWLDGRYATSPWWTLSGAVVGISLGIYGFLAPFLKKRP